MGVGWAWLRPERWWPVTFALVWVGAESLRGVVPFGGLPWGTLAFGLVDTPVVRWGRVGGTAIVSFIVVLAVAVIVDVIERRDRRPLALGSVAAVLALTVGSLALPTGIAGADGTTQVAAVQGNVPGEGMNPFAERRAVLEQPLAGHDGLRATGQGRRAAAARPGHLAGELDRHRPVRRPVGIRPDRLRGEGDRRSDPGRRGRERPGRRTTCATWASCGARRRDRGSST